MGAFLPTIKDEGQGDEEALHEWADLDTSEIMGLMDKALKKSKLDDETKNDQREKEDSDDDKPDTHSVVREINTVMQVFLKVYRGTYMSLYRSQ